MNDHDIEKEITDNGLTAPRVTVGQIDELMASLHYERWIVPNTTTTIVVAMLPNGFTVGIGKSASVSAKNFNAEIGAKIATAEAERNARDKLWELEGYALKSRMEEAQ